MISNESLSCKQVKHCMCYITICETEKKNTTPPKEKFISYNRITRLEFQLLQRVFVATFLTDMR